MAASRPTVSIYNAADGKATGRQIACPAVMTAPVRPDIVGQVHTEMAKNKRQAYAVKYEAGMQTAAESWGTGRAVARIPRVPGGGTSRSGQGAFGNMCRGGRMFAPTKTWRRWHRRIAVNQRRYALASALAASAVPALVMARGHEIDSVPEIPLVLANAAVADHKTAKALAILKAVGAGAELEKCKKSKKLRAGKGKMRNRRYVMRKGPLVVYEGDNTFEKAYRNLPGVELCHVDRLNLLQLAPGGHLGRFVIWTEEAFARLDKLYGTYSKKSELKSGYSLPSSCMSNADLARIINSDEVQSAVRPAQQKARKAPRKKNPLKNLGAMVRLNPYALAHRRTELRAQAARKAGKAAKVKAARNKKAERTAFYNGLVAE